MFGVQVFDRESPLTNRRRAMFNPFFRSYLPGFRVGPDDVPGFNIDENGLPDDPVASAQDAIGANEDESEGG